MRVSGTDLFIAILSLTTILKPNSRTVWSALAFSSMLVCTALPSSPETRGTYCILYYRHVRYVMYKASPHKRTMYTDSTTIPMDYTLILHPPSGLHWYYHPPNGLYWYYHPPNGLHWYYHPPNGLHYNITIGSATHPMDYTLILQPTQWTTLILPPTQWTTVIWFTHPMYYTDTTTHPMDYTDTTSTTHPMDYTGTTTHPNVLHWYYHPPNGLHYNTTIGSATHPIRV